MFFFLHVQIGPLALQNKLALAEELMPEADVYGTESIKDSSWSPTTAHILGAKCAAFKSVHHFVWVADMKLSLCAPNADRGEGVIKPKEVTNEKEVCSGVVKPERGNCVISGKIRVLIGSICHNKAWGKDITSSNMSRLSCSTEGCSVCVTEPHLRMGIQLHLPGRCYSEAFMQSFHWCPTFVFPWAALSEEEWSWAACKIYDF